MADPAVPIDESASTTVKLALLTEQMSSMRAVVEDIRRDVREVVALDSTIARLAADQEHRGREMKTQWDKIDAQAKALTVTDQKVDAWINRARGAWVATACLAGMAQLVVVGLLGWLLLSVVDLGQQQMLQKQNIEQISSRLRDAEQFYRGGTTRER